MAKSKGHIYWTSVEDFGTCPRLYLWKHGYGSINLGRGPGRPKAKPVDDSRHHSVMGIVLAKAVEHLYNDELWREPAKLPEVLENIIYREFTFAISENYVDWAVAPAKSDMHRTCLNGALGYIQTMKANKLLGPYARSEVNLTAWVDSYTPVGGTPDVIIRRDDTGVTIIDGKNSLTPGLYTDPNQLRWYAMCFYLIYKVIPKRLAFAYFRYPAGGDPPKGHPEGEPWTGLVDVSLTPEDLTSLGERAKETLRLMRAELFDPTPSAKACKFCDYQTVCDVAHQPTPRAKKSLPILPGTVEHILQDASGMVEFGFGAPGVKGS